MVNLFTSLIPVIIIYILLFAVYPEFLGNLYQVLSGSNQSKYTVPELLKRLLLLHVGVMIVYTVLTISRQPLLYYWIIGGTLGYINLYRKPLSHVDRMGASIVMMMFVYIMTSLPVFSAEAIGNFWYSFIITVLFVVANVALFVYGLLSLQLGEKFEEEVDEPEKIVNS